MRYEYRLPVRSIVFLLRKAADGSSIRGAIDDADGTHRLQFGYAIVWVWQQDVRQLLAGGLAALPLAPLAAKSPEGAMAAIYAVHDRLHIVVLPDDIAQGA